MSLKNDIIKIKPRENAGSRSASRFDFQNNWALSELIEREKQGLEYIFLFDYHEDIVILETETNPQKINFYQIKGKEGKNWTISSLTKSSKDKKTNTVLLSILGKLFSCREAFLNSANSLNFVSNALFDVELQNDKTKKKREVCVIELANNEKDKIKNAIKNENISIVFEDIENITFLHTTDLSVSDSATHLLGKFTEFLNDRLNSKITFPVKELLNYLELEIKRKSTFYNYDEINDFDELVKKKGYRSSEFKTFMEKHCTTKDWNSIKGGIKSTLESENMRFGDIKLYLQEIDKYMVDSMNPNHEILKKIEEKIDIIKVSIKPEGKTFMQIINECFDCYSGDAVNQNLYNEQYIKAIIMIKCYE